MKNKNESVKPGYKMTPLGEIPEDWEVKRLADIGRISSGSTPLRSELKYHTNGSIPWIKTTDLNNSLITVTEEKVTELAVNETALRIYPSNTVLVAMYGGFNQIGRTGIIGVPSTINQALSAVNVDTNSVDPWFLLHWLNANRNLWKKYAGSSRKDPNITSKDVANFPFIQINLAEQKAIAKVLSTWDEAIEKTRQLIEKKELRKKALMQQLLTGKKRLKGFSGEWKEVKLYDLFDRVLRKNDENCSNIVTLSAQRGFVKQDIFFNKIIASDTVDSYFLLERGEFCYNKSYSKGYPWGAVKRLDEFDKAVVTTLYICFSLRMNGPHSVDFFKYFFDANLLDRGLTQIAHEGGRAHGLLNVTPSDFFNLEITIPNPDEQRAIANSLELAYKDSQYANDLLKELINQKKALMQVLLTGKKRLKFTKEVNS